LFSDVNVDRDRVDIDSVVRPFVFVLARVRIEYVFEMLLAMR